LAHPDMPIYVTTITAPPNTSKGAPKETDFYIEGELLTEVQIVIPPGHCALTGIQAFYGIEQLFPLPTGEWLTGDSEVLKFPQYWPIPFQGTTIKLKTYNEDDTYDHTFILRFIISTFKEARYWEQILDEIKVIREGLRSIIGHPLERLAFPFELVGLEI